MNYRIEGKELIVKCGLLSKGIEIERITKIKLGNRKCIFFENEKVLLSCKLRTEFYDLADILFKKYNCVEIEFDERFVNNWRGVNACDFEKEIAGKKILLDDIFEKIRNDAPFKLNNEMEINSDKYTFCYNVKGTINDKSVIVSNGKKSVEWGAGVIVIAPHIINKDVTKSRFMVNDKCSDELEIYFANALRYAKRNGYHVE